MKRPDAAPPKEVPILCIQKGCGKSSGHKGRHTDGTLPGHVTAQPPSDTAQPEDEWEGFSPPKSITEVMLRYPDRPWEVLNMNHLAGHDYRIVRVAPSVDGLVIWIKDKARPEDAPRGPTVHQIAKILCPGYEHTLRALMTDADRETGRACPRCLVWAVGIRDALNRLRGDKTDG